MQSKVQSRKSNLQLSTFNFQLLRLSLLLCLALAPSPWSPTPALFAQAPLPSGQAGTISDQQLIWWLTGEYQRLTCGSDLQVLQFGTGTQKWNCVLPTVDWLRNPLASRSFDLTNGPNLGFFHGFVYVGDSILDDQSSPSSPTSAPFSIQAVWPATATIIDVTAAAGNFSGVNLYNEYYNGNASPKVRQSYNWSLTGDYLNDGTWLRDEIALYNGTTGNCQFIVYNNGPANLGALTWIGDDSTFPPCSSSFVVPANPARFMVYQELANLRGMAVRLAPSATANAFEVQDSSGNVLASISSLGGLTAPDKGSQVYNVKAYGAVASVATGTATTTSGSPSVTLDAAYDFANGQYVMLIGAGPTCTLSAPTALSVTPENATGGTSYTYSVTAVGPNGCETVESTPVTITNGYSSLGGAAWNKLGPWTAPAGTVQYYRVYGCSGANCSRKFIGFSYSTAFADSGEQGTLGGVTQSTIAPPAAATRDNLFTTIVSGGGTTTLVLANAPSVTSNSIVFEHDNYTPIANALAGSNTASVWLPPGRYAIAATLTVTLSNRFSGVCGESFDSRMSSPSSQLVWQGQDAGLAVRAWDTNLGQLECVIADASSIAGGGTSNAMTAWYVDGTNVSNVGGASGTTLQNLWASGAKIGFQQGGNYCTLSAAAPNCDTSAVTMRGLYNHSSLNSSTGFVWKSTNAGNFSEYDNLETWNQGTYGFRLLMVGGGHFSLNRPQCNGPMQTGGSCIDLESPGSQIKISGATAEASGISYLIRAPVGQSGNGNGLYLLEDNWFGNSVSIESVGTVLSMGNVAASSGVTASVSNGANVISIGDNLWNSWTASTGSTVLFAFGRNFNNGAILNSAAALVVGSGSAVTSSGTGGTLITNSTTCGGDLSGTFPNCSVAKVTGKVNTVGFSATPTFDASLANTQKITLTGNVTSSTLLNVVAGASLTFIIKQGGTGSWTFTWPSNVYGGATVGSTASMCSIQSFVVGASGQDALAIGPGVTNVGCPHE